MSAGAGADVGAGAGAAVDEPTAVRAPRRAAAGVAGSWPVLAVAGVLGLALALTGGRYGYFGDELYFWAAGHHLDWGFADQPPLLPLLARAMDVVAPGSPAVMRLPALVCAVGGVPIAAAIAREMGGTRRARLLTAAAVAGSPVLGAGGHVLATTPVDTFLWIVVTWLLVRWVRLRDDRLLLWSGLVTGLALQGKYTIVFFWLVAGVAIAAAGPRELLRRPWFLAGMAVAALSCVPAVLWQARNGWPQLELGAVLAGEHSPAGFFLLLLGSAGVLGTPLLVYGLWRALRTPEYRFLGWALAGLVLVFVLTFGAGYYVTGLFPALWAAGAVGLDRVRGRWPVWVAWPLAVLSAAMVLAVLPVRPVETLAGQDGAENLVNAESVGWPELADAVAGAYRALPPEVRRRTVVVTGHYWSASAIERYGPARGLPHGYSPHRGFWYFGPPPDDATVTLYVGDPPARLRDSFTRVRRVAAVDNGLNVRNTFQGAPIWLCEEQRERWSALWGRLRVL
ncbi:ArnT family glycosyltransferase [Microbispora sp. H10670]|uniref:ArnT family glycosyltransferase n=1 Tax=Microbispora sp. H10670 TaxID=2729108 RepID=UPI0015FF3F0A|nr:glycosyltransferase family 39 protein [Microbispora sp. H10670]